MPPARQGVIRMRITPYRSPRVAAILALTLLIPPGSLARAQSKPGVPPAVAATQPPPPPGTNADTGWPRTVALKHGTVVWYQPQVESWIGPEEHRRVVGRGVHADRRQGAGARHDQDRRPDPASPSTIASCASTCEITRIQLQVAVARPGQGAGRRRAGAAAERSACSTSTACSAYVADEPARRSRTSRASRPTRRKCSRRRRPRFSSTSMASRSGARSRTWTCSYAVNTNWDLFEHTPTQDVLPALQRVVAAGARRSTGRGRRSGKLPDSFSKLPADDNWKDVKAAVPGQEALGQRRCRRCSSAPTPAELIVARGRAQLSRGRGCADAAVGEQHRKRPVPHGHRPATSTSSSPAAGSRRASLDGPWTFATPSLPEDFKKIPVEHPRSRVLASVPGTPQATEAVLLATIPRTARVNKKELKAPDVVYPGRARSSSRSRARKGVAAGRQHRQGHRQVRRPLLHVLPGRVVHVARRRRARGKSPRPSRRRSTRSRRARRCITSPT